MLSGVKLYSNLIIQTVDAGIKVIMLLQRACDAEKQVKYRLSNGPRRVQ